MNDVESRISLFVRELLIVYLFIMMLLISETNTSKGGPFASLEIYNALKFFFTTSPNVTIKDKMEKLFFWCGAWSLLLTFPVEEKIKNFTDILMPANNLLHWTNNNAITIF